MSEVVLFAGTTEGRQLSEWLCGQDIPHVICVATEYGEQIMQEAREQRSLAGSCMRIHSGRMNSEEMAALINEESPEFVVDATHPYALEVSLNIRSAAEQCGRRYLRLERECGVCGKAFAGIEECEQYIRNVPGNILVTTGSKELGVLCRDAGLRKRLFVRVLPSAESIRICEEAGLSGRQIIAMQGPFSEELNIALIRQFDISCIITKASGSAGGFDEKINAARKCGIEICVIGNPPAEGGYSMSEICRIIRPAGNGSLHIALIGCGMGTADGMTAEALKVLESADLVCGSERLLSSLDIKSESRPYYLASDIIPLIYESIGGGKTDAGIRSAAVLFSGDTGFYSGCSKLYSALSEEVSSGRLRADICIFPGISSVAALSAQAGYSWDDAKMISLHGREEDACRKARILDAVRHNRKVFLLTSGAGDIEQTGSLLAMSGLGHCRMIVGYQMGNEDQQILELSPAQSGVQPAQQSPDQHPASCRMQSLQQLHKGLYSLFIINEQAAPAYVFSNIPDGDFIRGKVPMTKEEIRAVSISKLQLRADSVVYDVGSGTGSVAITIARQAPDIQVYAIEKKPEASGLIRENLKHFGTENVIPVEADAPDGFDSLPVPTHVFIGGSGGNMKTILEKVITKNPRVRVVINAVSLETLREVMSIPDQYNVSDFEITSVAVSRSRELGAYHMMKAENPVWICSFRGNS